MKFLKPSLTFLGSLLALGCVDPGPTPPAIIYPADDLGNIDPTPAAGCTGSWVVGVRGRVVNESGAGIQGIANACVTTSTNEFQCLEGVPTDANGYWNFAVPAPTPGVEQADSRCISLMRTRAVTSTPGFAATYCELPTTNITAGIMEMDQAATLYRIDAPSSLPPRGDENAVRDVVFADGLVVEVVPARLFGSDYDNLAARRVNLAAGNPCFVEDSDNLLGLYAMGPEVLLHYSDNVGFRIRIPNNHGLNEGDRVELLALGGLEVIELDDKTIHEAEFDTFGTATVVGSEIVSDPGSELPAIGWFGYRRMQ